MKKVFVLILALVMLAVPAFAATSLVWDGEGLLSAAETQQLEALYADYEQSYGFTPILVTTDSFDGYDAESYAGVFYDSNGYPQDGILYLVSLTEGEWYILTNGACYDRISDHQVEMMGQELVEYLRDKAYYEAFVLFPELACEHYTQESESIVGGADGPTDLLVTSKKNYGKTIAICMGVGLLIGGITVGIMASMMKSVRPQNSAADYVRPGSMKLTNQRDIFLYSQVHRTPKPKNNSSGGLSGGSRGGAGGRI